MLDCFDPAGQTELVCHFLAPHACPCAVHTLKSWQSFLQNLDARMAQSKSPDAETQLLVNVACRV